MTAKIKISDLKYLMVLTIPLGVGTSLYFDGIISYMIPFMNFLIIPIIDLLLPEVKTNPTDEEEAILKVNPLFDYILYINVFFQFFFLFYLLNIVSYGNNALWENIGKIWTMGICTAVLGINTAHELGHRNNKFEVFLSKLLLMSALYMHFYIEHNRGHHKNVATPLDPSTARKGETVYAYYFRSVFGGYLSAWRLAAVKMRKEGNAIFSFKNEMIQFHLIQLAFVSFIFVLFGLIGVLTFLAVVIIGISVLETINYVEHYGLEREMDDQGRYEKVKPWHSWNSDHILGRIMLLELTRHSDHHYKASRKYPTLRHLATSPELPLGYPGSMVLAWFPPLWFKVMDKRIEKMEHKRKAIFQENPSDTELLELSY